MILTVIFRRFNREIALSTGTAEGDEFLKTGIDFSVLPC